MPFVFLQASNRSAAPQPGSRWRPEEDEKLINLLARGEDWTTISNTPPGRSKTSCIMHHHQSLANRMRLGSEGVVQARAFRTKLSKRRTWSV
ncbi:hypothetical protein F4680DRAFT_256143 [Xylaria scruposa]|nr:hypothetical protein F4680DRAFT_256143 [Xylaria scruposa]